MSLVVESEVTATPDTTPLVQRFFAGIIPALLCVATIVGNSFTILSIVLNKRLRRKETNVLMINLAVADLLVGLFVMPLSALLIFTGGYWPFGRLLCRIWVSADVISCTASIVTLCGISADRYVGVSKPLQYRSIMTHRRLITSSVIVWIFSIGTLILTIRWSDATVEQTPGECYVGNELKYVTYSTILSFFLPTVVILGVNVQIYRLSGKPPRAKNSMLADLIYENAMTRGRAAAAAAGERRSTGVFFPMKLYGMTENPNDVARKSRYEQRLREHAKQRESAKAFGIVVFVFLVCWVPFFTLYLIGNL